MLAVQALQDQTLPAVQALPLRGFFVLELVGEESMALPAVQAWYQLVSRVVIPADAESMTSLDVFYEEVGPALPTQWKA